MDQIASRHTHKKNGFLHKKMAFLCEIKVAFCFFDALANLLETLHVVVVVHRVVESERIHRLCFTAHVRQQRVDADRMCAVGPA